MSSAQMERNKTKEQLEEEKKISLSFRIKPLEIENLSVEKLKFKASELWDAIVKLETEKYDLEERQKRQDYDVSILNSSYHPQNILHNSNYIISKQTSSWTKKKYTVLQKFMEGFHLYSDCQHVCY